jgi:light-regulated signal transduction histidine kinase (bacteriophytochrome)
MSPHPMRTYLIIIGSTAAMIGCTITLSPLVADGAQRTSIIMAQIILGSACQVLLVALGLLIFRELRRARRDRDGLAAALGSLQELNRQFTECAGILKNAELQVEELRDRAKVTATDASQRLAAAELTFSGRLNRANEQCRATTQELDATVRALIHELVSPLMTINGFSQILTEDYYRLLDDEGQTSLKRIRESALQMQGQIESLKKFTNTTAGGIVRSNVFLSGMATEIITELSSRTGDRVIEWTVEPDLWADCDPALVRIVLENLLNNAWKFTRPSTPARVSFGAMVSDGQATFFVRDNGVGFEPARAHKLFGIFQRLHLRSEFDGNGVGLAMAKRIVQKHGGRIWAEGSVGMGATLYFTLKQDAHEGILSATELPLTTKGAHGQEH